MLLPPVLHAARPRGLPWLSATVLFLPGLTSCGDGVRPWLSNGPGPSSPLLSECTCWTKLTYSPGL